MSLRCHRVICYVEFFNHCLARGARYAAVWWFLIAYKASAVIELDLRFLQTHGAGLLLPLIQTQSNNIFWWISIV